MPLPYPPSDPAEPGAHVVAAGTQFLEDGIALTSGADLSGRGLGGDMPTTGGVAATMSDRDDSESAPSTRTATLPS